MELGQRIKTRRKELDLSLRNLAEQVDLTASFLSQVERDLVSPSIDSLRKISHALEVPIFYFLVEANSTCPVVRWNQRRKIIPAGSHLTYELLTPDLNRKMEVIMIELEPGKGYKANLLREQTEECIYVLQGQLEIGLAETFYRLEPGDSVYFEGPMLRYITARGDEMLRFITVITPPVF
jgi:transcriptional regulator with XRE-family HTH domain